MKILLVEDHKSTAAAMTMLLSRYSHQVTTAHTLAEAKELCLKQQFDLLLCDIQLPNGTGYEFMREVAAVCRLPGIAVTARAFPEDIERSLAAGFIEHLTKPFSPEDLLAAIERVARRGNPE